MQCGRPRLGKHAHAVARDGVRFEMEGVDRARELLWQESERRTHLLWAEVHAQRVRCMHALRVRCMLGPPQRRGCGGGKDARHWGGYWRTAGAGATSAQAATAARAARASSSTPHAAASSASSGRIHSAAQAAAGG